jgi:NAD-dependent SIR2 family protein deacetylase
VNEHPKQVRIKVYGVWYSLWEFGCPECHWNYRLALRDTEINIECPYCKRLHSKRQLMAFREIIGLGFLKPYEGKDGEEAILETETKSRERQPSGGNPGIKPKG